MGDYFIGLISGTSMDGIDAALVEFGEASLELLQTRQHAYDDDVRKRLAAAIAQPAGCDVDALGNLDHAIGQSFRDAANALLADAGIDSTAVAAIGSHGQTLRHQPHGPEPFTLQIGDPAIIAAGTGITTVADFRRADLALGGEGAPLAPAFHEWLFREAGVLRVVVNIGGIANITVLPADPEPTGGFDTGPGNTLMDAWTRIHQSKDFDRDGAWAASGSVNEDLLTRFRADAYFSAKPPKSTGFEYFNLDWLEKAGTAGVAAHDVQATLCELSAITIADAVRSTAGQCEVLCSGGGVHNKELMRRLGEQLADYTLGTTASAGLDPDWVEAVLFAWLAMRRLHDLPGNLPAVTGASRAAILGAIYAPPGTV